MLTDPNDESRQKIYDIICYECGIAKTDFSPDIVINYGKYELRGECADILTFEAIPDALGIPQSYDFPFDNSLYFRDSGNPIIFVINLFKKGKLIRPPLTAKHYADMILPLYDDFLKVQIEEQKQLAILIENIPQEKRAHLQKKLFALLMQTLSIKEEKFSPDIVINDGIYKLSGRKAERFIHQTELCFGLSKDTVYYYCQEKKYFDLPMSLIGWVMMIIFSPIFLFAYVVMSIIYSIIFIKNCICFVIKRKWESVFSDEQFLKKEQKQITAGEYTYEILGLWAKAQQKKIELVPRSDPFI